MDNKRVDQVMITYLKGEVNQNYSDDSESFLNDFFDSPQSKKEKEIRDILSQNPSWPILYHLSPQREALLDWYPFRKNCSILEVGAGCGALTGLLTKRLKKVCSNELTQIRGEIIAKRYSDAENLHVLIGNVQNINMEIEFDYVSLVGVLEYAGKFFAVNDNLFYEPYLSFLLFIKKFLKKQGHLILAIENKLGIKYFSGGKEDHYGNYFSSLENYPYYNGVRTFSKNELVNILKKAGYKKIVFYYPFPDYKLPVSIFSEEGLYAMKVSRSSRFRVVDFSNARLELFNEVIVSGELLKESVLDRFSNSFLVDASI